MAIQASSGGWERLSNGFDVEFRHGIPYRVSDNGRELAIPTPMLLEEITALGKLHVTLGQWQPGEGSGEQEARLYVSDRDFAEVLHRLACSAANVFVDRYHKAVDDGDTDWDRLEYLKDFHIALDCCGLAESDVDPDAFRDTYVGIMHRETRRLAQAVEETRVEPEADT
jgi:hypothetical protein